ncbi:hypothetical protein ACFWXK_09110 [Streptomyces sp. NPDC059070]|uniref:hypothetical protein n=1 Tax=Streptomyces sp. NPDC059070 TaxID=3346713 RepID=UPI0036BB12E3
MKKSSQALTGAAAAALLLVGAGSAGAQTAQPFTGSTGCTSSNYVHQYTRYHGTICYTNPGYDDLTTSGFWTSKITSGSNYIRIRYCYTDGSCGIAPTPTPTDPDPYFLPNTEIDFSPVPSGVISLTGLWIRG